MSDELDKLKRAMGAATPDPSDAARDRAISAGMEEFEKTFQGSEATVRPTGERAQWWALPEGAVKMFRRLATRETLLTTASVAAVLVAVVVTQDFNRLPNDDHGPIIVGEFADTPVGATLQSPPVTSVARDETQTLSVNEIAPLEGRIDDSFAAGAVSKVEGEEVAAERDRASAVDTVATIDLNVGVDESGEMVVTGRATGGQSTTEEVLIDNLGRADLDTSLSLEGLATSDIEPSFSATTTADYAGEGGAAAYVAPVAPMIVAEQEAMPADRRVANPPVAGILAQSDGFALDMIAPQQEPTIIAEANTEQFPDADVNPLKVVAEEPVSTFSIDVDTASYGIVRSSLMNGHLPPADAVRTEELVNYFTYDYPLPQAGEAPFSTSVTVMETPWNKDTKLLHIGIQGYDIPAEERPPVNLVFLIDTSGSMNDTNKLPLLINSFRLMLANLQPDDQVAIVTYAGSAGMALEPTPASDSAKILSSLQNLSAGGSTAGQAGLQQAYALAEQMGQDGDISRVILATDGDFNVGISDPAKLQSFVEDKRDSGVYLSVLGFGRGNYNDTIMQTLAQNGNGTAAYIDTLAEAQKVLVDQIGGALFTIAQDVKIQIEFNPAEIAEYRLIGYETRALNREDFNNDAVDAGEIGAGHSVTAIYEITPVGSPAISVDDLRYTATDAQPASESTGEYAFLKLRYKNPGEAVSNLITTPVFADTDAGIPGEASFAAAVAGFAQILRDDSRIRGWDIDDARALADANKGEDAYGYRAELLTLMRLANSLK